MTPILLPSPDKGGTYLSISDNEWQQEQQRVKSVTAKISNRIHTLEQEVGAIKLEVVSIRKHFWDDVTVNVSNADETIETHLSLRQQAEVLSERERSYQHSASTLAKWKRLSSSPYFGRIDFQEQGEQQIDPIYLGIASFLDEDELTFLVYDWRAPVSNLYYDYSPGPASYQTPMGEIEGEILLKRQYVIRDGDIRLMFDAGVTIGDEMLQQVLSRNSDAHMKSIVATIQREQNQIIRNTKSRLLIVQGAAGSGKTSAALQRVAYLLYKHRETLAADQMILFSPNPLFNSYVSSVLPELGEENMQQTTFQEYLEYQLRKKFEIEDPFQQIEYTLTQTETPGYDARISGIRFKSSAEYLHVIQAYSDLLEHEGMVFLPVKFREQEVISAERIRDQFYSYEPGTRLQNRINELSEWLLSELEFFKEAEMEKDWVQEEITLLDIEDYQRAYQHFQRQQKRKKATFDDFSHEEKVLSAMVVDRALRPTRKWINKLRFVHVLALYKQIFKNRTLFDSVARDMEIPSNWDEIARQTLIALEQRRLFYEDATPYLYLQQLVQGFETNNQVRHVIIDEAQDYSPFQFEFLKRLFPLSKMTALGDLNQAIYAQASAMAELHPLIQLYGEDQTEFIRLKRSYRSTREIVEFTRGMIAGGDEIEPFNRAGDKPVVASVAETGGLASRIAADIRALYADGYESIAVICKTASESKQAHQALQQMLQDFSISPQWITKETPTFEKGLLVLPAYLAKGVEFDAVLIYNGSKEEYRRENERKLFYTACTRAMHFLKMYYVGETSPFISEQNPDTYIREE